MFAESEISANKDSQGVKWSGVREQEEGCRGQARGAGERTRHGRELQAGGHFRTSASPFAAVPREDYGQYHTFITIYFVKTVTSHSYSDLPVRK